MSRLQQIGFSILCIAQCARGAMDHERLYAADDSSDVVGLVLLDDSVSMAHASSGTTAYARVLDGLQSMGEAAVNSGGTRRLIVVKLSEAARGERGRTLDLERGASAVGELVAQLRREGVTQQSLSLRPALATCFSICRDSNSLMSLFVFSDFEVSCWEREDLAVLDRSAPEFVACRLILCETTHGRNLAIEDLQMRPAADTAALQAELTVRNSSDSEVESVPVRIYCDGSTAGLEEIGPVGAGTAVVRTFMLPVEDDGRSHWVAATLPEDVFSPDNTRYAVSQRATQPRILEVYGMWTSDSPAVGLRDALNTLARTGDDGGGAPSVVSCSAPDFTGSLLEDVDVVCLDAGGAISEEMSTALDEFVFAGGSLVFVAGPGTDAATLNRVAYRDGRGWFPFETIGIANLPADPLETGAPDVSIEGPVADEDTGFGMLTGLLDNVRVRSYLAVRHEPVPAGVHVFARLRNGAPLVVRKRHGRGAVVALLTAADPTWTNWPMDASWVPLIDLTIKMSLKPQMAGFQRLVGEPLEGRPWSRDRVWTMHRNTVGVSQEGAMSTRELLEEGTLDQSQRMFTCTRTLIPGVYEAMIGDSEVVPHVMLFAVNLPQDVNRLRRPTIGELRNRTDAAVSELSNWAKSLKDLPPRSSAPREDLPAAGYARIVRVDRTEGTIDLAIVQTRSEKSVVIQPDAASSGLDATVDRALDISERITSIRINDAEALIPTPDADPPEFQSITGDELWQRLLVGGAVLFVDRSQPFSSIQASGLQPATLLLLAVPRRSEQPEK